MDLRDLRYFETIAEMQHMGRAAARLHRTQPALTSSVRRLEEDCGTPLFERAGRGIRLTAAGKVLQKWARQMRIDEADAKKELAAIGHGMAGHVRIGIVPTVASFVLPPVARKLLHEAPELTMSTVVGLVDNLKPLLQAGEIDLMVVTQVAEEPGLVSRVVAEDAIVVVAGANHAIFQVRNTKLKDLVPYRWALQPPGAPTRDWLDQAFDRKRLPRPRVQIEGSMLLVLPALIEQTGLLSFESRLHLAAAQEGSGLKEVPVRDAVMRRRLVVSYRANSYLSPVASRFIDLLAGSHRTR